MLMVKTDWIVTMELIRRLLELLQIVNLAANWRMSGAIRQPLTKMNPERW